MWFAKRGVLLVILLVILGGIFLVTQTNQSKQEEGNVKDTYWFVLHRKSNTEELFKGIPGDENNSTLVRTFQVKSGILGERPTPLPQLLGREYWLLVDKFETFDNPETSPYFLTLDIPAPSEPPYGPTPYNECNGEQCDWILPGAFGLHGTASDSSRLSDENPGSSGCIRHSDTDITYLYHLLDPQTDEIRYYIEDN